MENAKFNAFKDAFTELATKYTELVTLKVNKKIEETKADQVSATPDASIEFTDMVRVAGVLATTVKRLDGLDDKTLF